MPRSSGVTLSSPEQQGVWWRRFNGALIPLTALLWVLAFVMDWLASVTFVSHISMFALVLAAISAWRSDKPTPSE